MSVVEGGTSEERKIMQEWFDKIVMKDDRVLSHMMLTHYWSALVDQKAGQWSL